MAAVNRYTDLTPSKFNPLSMQEVFAVPMLKRQQHNQLLAEQAALRTGLAKVDPHDKYFNEAVRIKNDLETKMDQTASDLASKGVNNDMIGQTIALNREYQDLVSPTGKLGMINAHKQNLNKTYNDYLEASVKMGNPLDVAKIHADKAIQTHLQQPLYDEKGRVVDFKIDQGPAKYIDVTSRVNDLAKAAGFSSDEWKKSAGSLTFDPTGNRYVINSNSAGLSSSNKENLAKLAQFMNEEISNPATETRRSLDYNFQDPQQALNRIQTQLGIYRTDKTGRENGYSIGSVDWTNADDAAKKAAGDPTKLQEAITVVNPTSKALDEIKSVGVRELLSQLPDAVGNLKSYIVDGKVDENKLRAQDIKLQQMLKDKMSPETLDLYTSTYNAKVAQGIIPRNTPMFSGKAQRAIQKDWEQKKDFAWSNNVILPDSVENDILASPQLIGKEAKDRNLFVRSRFDLAKKNNQTLWYDEDGKPVSLKDVDRSSIELVGHYDPANMLNDFGGGKDNAVSPHVISYKDNDGESHSVLMPRDANEKTTPNYKAAQIINKTIKKTVVQGNDFVSFTSKDFPTLKAKGIDHMRVKFDSNNKTFTIEVPGNKFAPMTQEEYSDFWYNNLNQ